MIDARRGITVRKEEAILDIKFRQRCRERALQTRERVRISSVTLNNDARQANGGSGGHVGAIVEAVREKVDLSVCLSDFSRCDGSNGDLLADKGRKGFVRGALSGRDGKGGQGGGDVPIRPGRKERKMRFGSNKMSFRP